MCTSWTDFTSWSIFTFYFLQKFSNSNSLDRKIRNTTSTDRDRKEWLLWCVHQHILDVPEYSEITLCCLKLAFIINIGKNRPCFRYYCICELKWFRRFYISETSDKLIANRVRKYNKNSLSFVAAVSVTWKNGFWSAFYLYTLEDFVLNAILFRSFELVKKHHKCFFYLYFKG